MGLYADQERERLHRFVSEAHHLLYHDAVKQLHVLQLSTEDFSTIEAAEKLTQALAAIRRSLRLLEYAMADTELIAPPPGGRRRGD